MAARTTAGKQRGRPFGRGVSGNPAGRPKGSRNRAAMMAEAFSDVDAVAILRAVVAKAKRGDMVAARIVLDHLLPVPKGRMVSFALPPTNNVNGNLQAHSAILRALADGALAPDEAETISRILAAHLRAIETSKLEHRLHAIEQRIGADEQKL